MYVKRGKYFADWLDADGRRRRRTFERASDARRYEKRAGALARMLRAARDVAQSIHHRQRAGLADLQELVQRVEDFHTREEQRVGIVAMIAREQAATKSRSPRA